MYIIAIIIGVIMMLLWGVFYDVLEALLPARLYEAVLCLIAGVWIYFFGKWIIKDAIEESIGDDLSEIKRLLEKKAGEDIDDYDENL